MKFMISIVSFLLVLTGLANDGYTFPVKPIKAIIGYEAGSSSDIAGRKFLKHVEKELGQPIMIINKPGAASAMALRELLASKADGYTIGLSCSVNVLKIQGLLPQDHRDFDVLGVPALTPSVVAVSAKTPFKSLRELIEYAKANPGKLRLSTTSKGAVFWIQANYFEKIAGVKFNIISNPGGASFIATQLGGGHADVGISSTKPLRSQLESGNLRYLGITTIKRMEGLENVPTLKEQGYDIVMSAWVAHLAPKGIPEEAYKTLVSAYSKVASSREWDEWCRNRGSVASPEYIGGEAGVKFLDQNADMQRPILEMIKGK